MSCAIRSSSSSWLGPSALGLGGRRNEQVERLRGAASRVCILPRPLGAHSAGRERLARYVDRVRLVLILGERIGRAAFEERPAALLARLAIDRRLSVVAAGHSPRRRR